LFLKKWITKKNKYLKSSTQQRLIKIGYISVLSILIGFCINLVAYAIRGLFPIDMMGAVIDELVCTLVAAWTGIIMLKIYKNYFGWAFVIGSILNIIFWNSIIIMLHFSY